MIHMRFAFSSFLNLPLSPNTTTTATFTHLFYFLTATSTTTTTTNPISAYPFSHYLAIPCSSSLSQLPNSTTMNDDLHSPLTTKTPLPLTTKSINDYTHIILALPCFHASSRYSIRNDLPHSSHSLVNRRLHHFHEIHYVDTWCQCQVHNPGRSMDFVRYIVRVQRR